MHKIHGKRFSRNDFSWEHLTSPDMVFDGMSVLYELIRQLNYAREMFLQTKDKEWWWQMIQLLPTSYNQKRTVTMTYENAAAMIKQRSGHKLDEWREFVEILKRLPYIAQIIGGCTAES